MTNIKLHKLIPIVELLTNLCINFIRAYKDNESDDIKQSD